MLDAALTMKLFIERIVQFAKIDGGRFVSGVVLVQRAQRFPMVFAEFQAFLPRGLTAAAAVQPAGA